LEGILHRITCSRCLTKAIRSLRPSRFPDVFSLRPSFSVDPAVPHHVFFFFLSLTCFTRVLPRKIRLFSRFFWARRPTAHPATPQSTARLVAPGPALLSLSSDRYPLSARLVAGLYLPFPENQSFPYRRIRDFRPGKSEFGIRVSTKPKGPTTSCLSPQESYLPRDFSLLFGPLHDPEGVSLFLVEDSEPLLDSPGVFFLVMDTLEL